MPTHVTVQQPDAGVVLRPGHDEPPAARQHRDVAARRVGRLQGRGVRLEGARAGAEHEEVVAVEMDRVGLWRAVSTRHQAGYEMGRREEKLLRRAAHEGRKNWIRSGKALEAIPREQRERGDGPVGTYGFQSRLEDKVYPCVAFVEYLHNFTSLEGSDTVHNLLKSYIGSADLNDFGLPSRLQTTHTGIFFFSLFFFLL